MDQEIDIHNQVVLYPWQKDWRWKYHLYKQCLIGVTMTEHHFIEAFHVGSTSVEGMIGKPIIDILLCPDDETAPEEVALKLEQFGYKNLGECGRPGRIFMSCGDKPGDTIYLHICHKDHQVAQDQLLFQKILRENRTVFSEYYSLKTLLAAVFQDDRNLYRAVKGKFVEAVLSAYRMEKVE